LRGKPYESIQIKLEQGLVIDPYYTKEYLHTITGLPEHWLTKGWAITAYIGGYSSADEANKSILNHLQCGAEEILISWNPGVTDLNAMLKEVQLELVKVTFLCNKWKELSKARKLINTLDDQTNIAIRYNGDSFEDWIEQWNGDDQIAEMVSLRIDEGVTSTILAKKLEVINHLLELVDKNAEKLLNSITIRWQVERDYVRSLIYIRSWHKLIHYLMDHYELNSRPILECHVDYGNEESPFHQMILASAMAMAAASSSADRISIHPLSKIENSPEGTRIRIAMNIHHLMKLESSMGLVNDPINGSYLVEVGSEKVAEKAWTKFTE
jgi:hypothetical protein